MNDGINFKLIGDKVNIATEQLVDMEEFERRISSIVSKKVNFNMQKAYLEDQIQEAAKTIPMIEANIKAAEEDLEKGFAFLKSVNRQDVIDRIKQKEEESKKQAEEQMKAEQKVHQ